MCASATDLSHTFRLWVRKIFLILEEFVLRDRVGRGSFADGHVHRYEERKHLEGNHHIHDLFDR